MITASRTSIDAIRADFPAVQRAHNGHPVAYFDGPGGTQVPEPVGKAMLDYLYHHNANTHWAYPTSAETDEALTRARETFGRFLAASPDEVIFGANMTTITYHLARGLARGWREGDEVIVTELDHHANIDPWRALESDFGIRVRMAAMHAADGQLDWDDFESLVGPRTRLVAIGAASNALGTINDLDRAVSLARSVGALAFVDGVHYAPHALVDVGAIDCDFFACSPYKFYGPHLGVLYARRNVMESLDIPRLVPAADAPPESAETGTLNHEGIVGAEAAVEWLAGLSGVTGNLRDRLRTTYAGLHGRGEDLTRRMWDGLSAVEGVTLYGSPPGARRTPTVGFTVAGINARDVSRHLAESGVFTSHGDFYATTVVHRLGLADHGGLVRAGCAVYTTDDEVERLIDGVRTVPGRT